MSPRHVHFTLTQPTSKHNIYCTQICYQIFLPPPPPTSWYTHTTHTHTHTHICLRQAGVLLPWRTFNLHCMMPRLSHYIEWGWLARPCFSNRQSVICPDLLDMGDLGTHDFSIGKLPFTVIYWILGKGQGVVTEALVPSKCTSFFNFFF